MNRLVKGGQSHTDSEVENVGLAFGVIILSGFFFGLVALGFVALERYAPWILNYFM